MSLLKLPQYRADKMLVLDEQLFAKGWLQFGGGGGGGGGGGTLARCTSAVQQASSPWLGPSLHRL